MDTYTNVRPVQILLVEDNSGDVRLTIEALKEAKVLNKLMVVKDGVEALSLLRQEGQYAQVTPRISSCSTSTFPRKMVERCWLRSRATTSSNTFPWLSSRPLGTNKTY